MVDRKVASKARQLIPWPLEKIRFTEVGGIEGAREALGNGEADTFLWEQLMTKPLVDQGIFRRLGHIDTPWPCFVIVASQKTINSKGESLKRLLKIIRQEAPAFKQNPNAVDLIVDRFSLKPDDVVSWLSQTNWSDDQKISRRMLNQVVDTLLQVNAIQRSVQYDELCDDRFVVIEES